MNRTILLALLLAACGGSTTINQPTPAARRGVPGFDTREYPGDAAMQTWKRDSPYHWVGYYLEAPCRPNSTWTGRRATLASQGWGFAVLYVGEQQWSEQATPAPADSVLRCSRRNLTPDRGAAHALDAEQRAAAEGFGDGSIIYLNVERVEQVSDSLANYVHAWVTALQQRGRYRPGLYLHERNAPSLRAHAPDVPVWIARGSGFTLEAAPGESGVPGARIWQGRFNTEETWGGVTLRIDANVAAQASPSTPGG